MADVFVSYKRADRDRIAPLIDVLERLGVSVWFDARLEAGTGFDTEIHREVNDARVVLVFWSNESVASDWVRAEATVGRERGVLLPVFLDRAKPYPPFNLIHGEELVRWRGEAEHLGLRRTLSRLGQLIGRPGLAEYVGLDHADEDAVARWVNAFPNDPLAGPLRERLEAGAVAPAPAADPPPAPKRSIRAPKQAKRPSVSALGSRREPRPGSGDDSAVLTVCIVGLLLSAVSFWYDIESFDVLVSTGLLYVAAPTLALFAASRLKRGLVLALALGAPLLAGEIYLTDSLSVGLSLPIYVACLTLAVASHRANDLGAAIDRPLGPVTLAALAAGALVALAAPSLTLFDFIHSIEWPAAAALSLMAGLAVLFGAIPARLAAAALALLFVASIPIPAWRDSWSSLGIDISFGLFALTPLAPLSALAAVAAAALTRRAILDDVRPSTAIGVAMIAGLSLLATPALEWVNEFYQELLDPLRDVLAGGSPSASGAAIGAVAGANAPSFPTPDLPTVIISGAPAAIWRSGDALALAFVVLAAGVLGARHWWLYAGAALVTPVVANVILGVILSGGWNLEDLRLGLLAGLPLGVFFAARLERDTRS